MNINECGFTWIIFELQFHPLKYFLGRRTILLESYPQCPSTAFYCLLTQQSTCFSFLLAQVSLQLPEYQAVDPKIFEMHEN